MATEDTVNTIAKALGEVDEQPTTQIAGVVRALGDETSLALLEETQRIEQAGGMMLPDNSRRRTPGGVFFFLARQKLSHEDKVAIFRPVKPPKPAQPVVEATRFPRRRVIDVAPPRDAPAARPARAGFIPPGLPLAAKRVRARETIQNALAALPPDDQNNLLLDILAELYERRGVRIPEPATAAPAPRAASASEPPPPPPSQRPIPVPLPAAAAVPVPVPVPVAVPVAPPAAEPARDEPPSSEASRRPTATRARASAGTRPTKKRA